MRTETIEAILEENRKEITRLLTRRITLCTMLKNQAMGDLRTASEAHSKAPFSMFQAMNYDGTKGEYERIQPYVENAIKECHEMQKMLFAQKLKLQ